MKDARRWCWCVLFAIVVFAGWPAGLGAHPVPKDNHDRTIVVRLTSAAVVVEYRLELDELTVALELLQARVDVSKITDRKQIVALYLEEHASTFAENLVASLDDKPLSFHCTKKTYKLLDHVRCDFRFVAKWELKPDQEHTFVFQDGNFELDEASKIDLRLTQSPDLELTDVRVPSEALIATPAKERGPGDMDRLRRVRATVSANDVEPAAMYKPALPPDLVYREEPIGSGAEAKLGSPSVRVASVKPIDETNVSSSDETTTETKKDDLLDLLFDTRMGMAVLLLIAAGFGAAHALTPGHGKTMVAAYLVGERGTIGHAIVLGIVTTLTHTGIVLILAAVLPWFFPDASASGLQTALELVGGLLIAGLGLWLLMRRLAGKADHVHIGGGHHHHHHGDGHHHHDHDHDHDHTHEIPEGQTVGWWPIIALGVSGGIVPCWDAIILLGLSISAGKLSRGLPLLLAFSAGLAAVLVVLGLVVVYTRKSAEKRWGESDRFARIAKVLPIISSVFIIGMGVWLCYAATHH